MAECKPCSTPVDLNLKLSATIRAPVADPTDYRSLASVSSISYVHPPKYLLCGSAGLSLYA
jgi:hypothetical protein